MDIKSINFKKTMVLIFIVIGFIIMLFGLFFAMETFDPKYLVALASALGLIIAGFGILFKLFQDINSSEKQTTILNSTISNLDKSVTILNSLNGGDSYLDINIFQKHNKTANPSFFIMAIVQGKRPLEESQYSLLGTEIIIKADEETIYSTNKDFSIKTPYCLLNYTPSTKKDFIIFSITVVARNKNYMQYVIMKKHDDGYWYERNIKFDDLYGFLIRENYYRNGDYYPKELLNKYPNEILIKETFLSRCNEEKTIDFHKLFEFKYPNK